MKNLLATDFSHYEIRGQMVFSEAEIEVLTGFPGYFREFALKTNLYAEFGVDRRRFAGGLYLGYIPKDGGPNFEFLGEFRDGPMFRDGRHCSADKIHGLLRSVNEAEYHLTLQEKPTNWIDRGSCAVFETNHGYILYSVCFTQVYWRPEKEGLCSYFFNGLGALLIKLFGYRNDVTLYRSIAANMRPNEGGAQVANLYWAESVECMALSQGVGQDDRYFDTVELEGVFAR